MPFPGGLTLFVEVMEVLAGPEGIGIIDLKTAPKNVERHRVGGVALQLVAWVPRDLNQLAGHRP